MTSNALRICWRTNGVVANTAPPHKPTPHPLYLRRSDAHSATPNATHSLRVFCSFGRAQDAAEGSARSARRSTAPTPQQRLLWRWLQLQLPLRPKTGATTAPAPARRRVCALCGGWVSRENTRFDGHTARRRRPRLTATALAAAQHAGVPLPASAAAGAAVHYRCSEQLRDRSRAVRVQSASAPALAPLQLTTPLPDTPKPTPNATATAAGAVRDSNDGGGSGSGKGDGAAAPQFGRLRYAFAPAHHSTRRTLRSLRYTRALNAAATNANAKRHTEWVRRQPKRALTPSRAHAPVR